MQPDIVEDLSPQPAMPATRRYVHEQPPEDQKRYEFGEQEAKSKKVGLWQDKNPIPPWECRHPK